MLEDNVEKIGDEIATLTLKLDAQKLVLEELKAELEQRDYLRDAALLQLGLIELQQELEAKVNLKYVERERLVGGILSKFRELEQVAARFGFTGASEREALARHVFAGKAADLFRLPGGSSEGSKQPLQLTVKLDTEVLAEKILPHLQNAVIRGDDLGLD